MMTRSCLTGIIFAAIAAVLSAAGADYLSPVSLALTNDGRTLVVAEHGAERLAQVAVPRGEVETACSLGGPPTGVTLSRDGTVAYVTLGEVRGRVRLVQMDRNRAGTSIYVGHTPCAPVLSPDGAALYVCNRFDNNVAIIDLKRRKVVAEVKVKREPVAAAVSKDGGSLFVANHLPAGPADGDYTAAVVTVIDTSARKVAAVLKLPNGSTGLRGLCISPDAKHVYVTHILARYHLPTTQLARGWMNTNAMTVIDVAEREVINTVLLDSVDLGAANPWGVTCTPDNETICVAIAGTHEMMLIDRAGLHERLETAAAGSKATHVSDSPEDVPNDLTFLTGICRRIKLGGNGPRGIAATDDAIYAAEFFTDSIGMVKRSEPRDRAEPSIALGPQKKPDPVRRGEMLFNDGTMCFQNWQSCASCHPDARVDGLNWDLLNDGMGNPKNTKSLVLSHRTPPVMVSGVRDKAETAVRAGIRYIQFVVRPDADAADIDSYLESLEPIPSPYLVKGRLTRTARKGKRLFKSAGCVRCHPAPLFTNLKSYDIGLGRNLDKDRSFDTSTLVENWRTAPFLYDGRAATMREVLIQHNQDDKHGRTSGLSDKEIDALSEYVLSQ